MEQTIAHLFEEPFAKIILSKPRPTIPLKKCVIRPVSIKGKHLFQAEEFTPTQTFHKNLSQEEAVCYVREALHRQFEEIYFLTPTLEGHGFFKNNSFRFKRRTASCNRTICEAHNAPKKHLLEEGAPIAPLVALGIMDCKGRVFPTQMAKFVQINRFLDIFDAALRHFPADHPLTIADLCCGKSYLTFILHYFLKEIKKREAVFIGVDLKEDVIKTCEALRTKLGYDNLRFIKADVIRAPLPKKIDITVSLHACDTATDAVIQAGIQHASRVILSVPCCHKEAARQLTCPALNFMLKYGILKERFAALLTDALRADFLESNGYKTDVLEFVNFENSPKNIMIRAVKTADKKDLSGLKERARAFGLAPTILKNDL